MYKVIIVNEYVVYEGDNLIEARRKYHYYVNSAVSHTANAFPQKVLLLKDDEKLEEFPET
jgi:hypothetical protein